MRTQALQLALQTNKHNNQERTQVTLLVHLLGDILNDANCAAKGYPFINSPLGPSRQPNPLLGNHSCINTHLGNSEVSGTIENILNTPKSGNVGSSGGAKDLDAMDLPS
jgi:hypothetical protein